HTCNVPCGGKCVSHSRANAGAVERSESMSSQSDQVHGRYIGVNEHRLLHELLPYRMQSVDTLNLAMRMRFRWPEAPPMSIHINGNLAVEGNLNAFINPVIEAGLVHCRALLEFLGLCMTGDGKLGNISKRRRSDIGIEHFKTFNGNLS